MHTPSLGVVCNYVLALLALPQFLLTIYWLIFKQLIYCTVYWFLFNRIQLKKYFEFYRLCVAIVYTFFFTEMTLSFDFYTYVYHTIPVCMIYCLVPCIIPLVLALPSVYCELQSCWIRFTMTFWFSFFSCVLFYVWSY